MPFIVGPHTWSMARDAEGHRTYKLKTRVKANVLDGPYNVLSTPGLPLPGAFWALDNDVDVWAWCRADADVKPDLEGEPNEDWTVEQTFSTKPPDPGKSGQARGCQDVQIEDPILEPAKVSGSFSQDKEEAYFDRYGRPVLNAAFEQIRGPQVEFDFWKGTVTVEQNVLYLGAEVWGLMIDTVNDAPLWGFPRRCIKLNNVPWEVKYYGQCLKYYTRKFEFEISVAINPFTGGMATRYDRDILNEGTKALKGRWMRSQGAGATIHIISVGSGGAITAAEVNDLGSGYPKNSTIGLVVNGGNQNGVVLVHIDYTGKVAAPLGVAAVYEIYYGGTGYSTASAASTTATDGWVLADAENSYGELDTPNYRNPGHFDRFSDKKGQAAKTLLDAKGRPLGAFGGIVLPATFVHLEKYQESNFLQLGIPVAF